MPSSESSFFHETHGITNFIITIPDETKLFSERISRLQFREEYFNDFDSSKLTTIKCSHGNMISLFMQKIEIERNKIEFK